MGGELSGPARAAVWSCLAWWPTAPFTALLLVFMALELVGIMDPLVTLEKRDLDVLSEGPSVARGLPNAAATRGLFCSRARSAPGSDGVEEDFDFRMYDVLDFADLDFDFMDLDRDGLLFDTAAAPDLDTESRPL